MFGLPRLGEAGPTGRFEGQVHVEIMSADEIGEKVEPGFWHTVEGATTGRFCMAPEIVDRLRGTFELDDWQVFHTDGPVNLSRVMNIYEQTNRAELKYRSYVAKEFNLSGKSADMFEELGAALAGRYHVLAWDAADHGDSDPFLDGPAAETPIDRHALAVFGEDRRDGLHRLGLNGRRKLEPLVHRYFAAKAQMTRSLQPSIGGGHHSSCPR